MEKEIEENRECGSRDYIYTGIDAMWDADGTERDHNNDSTLDDAFEGDPDNIWNID